MNVIFRKNGIIIIFLILISITSIFPYFFNNYIFSQDDLLFHRTRLESYTLAVKHLDFFPRIFPTMGLNFGYGADLFYPSILLLPFALFRIGGFSFVSSYYLFQLFISFITAIISYYFFYSIHHSKKSSLLFSCFYTLSTYRLIDQSVRAALGETLAFAFLPLLVLGIYTLFYTHQHHWKLLAIGMSLLIASHLITAFYSFLLLLIFLIFNWKKCKLAQLKSLTKAFLLTVGLSAWFLFPYLEQIEQLKFNFNNTTLWANGLHFSLGDLFINSLTNLSAPFTELKPNIGLFLLVTIIAALFSYPKLTKTTQRLTLLTLFVILLATNLFPWAFFKTSILATIQFPWRLLLFASFFASLLAVYLIEQFQLDSKKEFLIFIALSIFLTIGFNSNNLVQARIQNNVTVTNENFSDFYESEIGHGKEYLVKDTDFKKYFASPALIIDGVSSTTNFSDPSSNKYNYNHFTLRTNGTQEVQLPKFFYKGYEVIDNQKVIPNYNKAGLVTVKLNEGEHALSISYKKTLVQKISVIFSILIFGILCFQYIGKKILNK